MSATQQADFDVIIIGASFAGLSAALALGRSLRKVLLIDSGKPCNRNTPHSHNFLTQDGVEPQLIAEQARGQVLSYPTVSQINEEVIEVNPDQHGFKVRTQQDRIYRSRKLLLATGVKDIMPDIPGFADCWGKTLLHCPYCHGYEVSRKRLGILAQGEVALEMAKLIQHWAGELTLLSNGPLGLEAEDARLFQKLDIQVIENPIAALEHKEGYLQQVTFQDRDPIQLDAVFARIPFVQNIDFLPSLGCATTEEGLVEVDAFQKTNVPGVFAAGDCSSLLRTVSLATAAGTMAGVAINMELIQEDLPS